MLLIDDIGYVAEDSCSNARDESAKRLLFESPVMLQAEHLILDKLLVQHRVFIDDLLKDIWYMVNPKPTCF